ncbi:hypothetical protein BO99DRAFT_150398 [Aspergillus violaceofuscus CBS 115571]|uniref:Secreted protein n=1 Tax=Aspergillus violaceofuscus (strain CBS 115571) TaxID=1450538 RepID=A0A2V5H4E1_ASPV1|nr:hypothetical protein BO99DRAFT_150398 [Aspergillus violaceofuscus CBS 115571]
MHRIKGLCLLADIGLTSAALMTSVSYAPPCLCTSHRTSHSQKYSAESALVARVARPGMDHLGPSVLLIQRTNTQSPPISTAVHCFQGLRLSSLKCCSPVLLSIVSILLCPRTRLPLPLIRLCPSLFAHTASRCWCWSVTS